MRKKILKAIERAGKEGILQRALSAVYGFSKSTVSTVLQELESQRIVVRKRVAGKSYRIWSVRYSPFPVEGHLRVGIIRAIEYPSVLLAAENCREVNIHVLLYNNAFSLTKDLAEGYLDAGCSPLITQTLFSLVYRSIRINAGCGFNGGGLVMRKTSPRVFGSSELSTMEYNLHRYMEERGMMGEIKYYSSPLQMMDSLESGDVDAIAIWEPYLTKLSKRYKTIRFEEIFGDYPCCTLASNVRMEKSKEYMTFLERYKEAFEEIDTRMEELVHMESKLFGMPQREIRDAFHGFKYSWKLSIDMVRHTLEKFGIKLSGDMEPRVFKLL